MRLPVPVCLRKSFIHEKCNIMFEDFHNTDLQLELLEISQEKRRFFFFLLVVLEDPKQL